MYTVELDQVCKSFGTVRAVDGLSFQVRRGEIFGLLGPNGAGKTTTLRLVLDIFKPDSGRIAVLGGPMDEARKNRIGYLPEERGLYQDQSLEAVLLYLAALKDVPGDVARQRLAHYLDLFDLSAFRNNKIKDLSKGMQQKAQIVATLLHEPELILIDEPFTGLDPVNTQLVKSMFWDLHRQGVTIIMSTHALHQVEELCERIVLINAGRAALYGELAEIRRRYSGQTVLIQTPQEELPPLPSVVRVTRHNAAWQLDLVEQAAPEQALAELLERHVPLEKFEIAVPNLEDIFVQVVKEQA